jgi:hypothetical protein
VDAVDRMIGDALQDMVQIEFRIDTVKLGKTENLTRTRAKRIPSRPGVVKHPNKAVYIRADLTCYSHFSPCDEAADHTYL